MSAKEEIRRSVERKQMRIAGTPPKTIAHVDAVPPRDGDHPLTNMYSDSPHTETCEREVPVRVGVYMMNDPPNDRTVNYKRRFEPTNERYPAIVENYSVTCQDSHPEWHVTHGVMIEEHKHDHASQKVKNMRRMGGGFETFDSAFEFMTKLAESRSITNSLPDELDQDVVDQYRKLKHES